MKDKCPPPPPPIDEHLRGSLADNSHGLYRSWEDVLLRRGVGRTADDELDSIMVEITCPPCPLFSLGWDQCA